MAEMDAVLGSNHNVTPPVLISSSASNENKGLENFDDEESDASASDFDAPGPSSAPVKGLRKKKRKLVSTPTKPKEDKKKRTSMSSKIEECLAKSEEVTSEMVEMLKVDADERKKERKATARHNKSFMKILAILAAGIVAKQPGSDVDAAEMAKAAASTDHSSDSESG